jgi:DnaJ family protein A protein 2
MIDDHTDFGRKGADLYHMHKISLLQALTGVCFELPLLDGTTILIASAPNEILSHDMKKVVKGKGMPFYKDPMSKGNLIVIFEIDFPKKGEINHKHYKVLSEILKQPLNPEAAVQVPEANYLEECKVAEKEEGDWEDEEGGEGQGQTVQCQQQ